jgi:hypothetical protein
VSKYSSPWAQDATNVERGNAVNMSLPGSCVRAVSDMLTERTINESQLLEKLTESSQPQVLADRLLAVRRTWPILFDPLSFDFLEIDPLLGQDHDRATQSSTKGNARGALNTAQSWPAAGGSVLSQGMGPTGSAHSGEPWGSRPAPLSSIARSPILPRWNSPCPSRLAHSQRPSPWPPGTGG